MHYQFPIHTLLHGVKTHFVNNEGCILCIILRRRRRRLLTNTNYSCLSPTFASDKKRKGYKSLWKSNSGCKQEVLCQMAQWSVNGWSSNYEQWLKGNLDKRLFPSPDNLRVCRGLCAVTSLSLNLSWLQTCRQHGSRTASSVSHIFTPPCTLQSTAEKQSKELEEVGEGAGVPELSKDLLCWLLCWQIFFLKVPQEGQFTMYC